MPKSAPTIAYSAIIIAVLLLVALIWSQFFDPVDLVQESDRLDTASLVRSQSQSLLNHPSQILGSSASDVHPAQRRSGPASTLDSAQMLRDRNFSDGYVPSSPLTVIRGPSGQQSQHVTAEPSRSPPSVQPQQQPFNLPALVAPDAHPGETRACYDLRKSRERINRSSVHNSTQWHRDRLLANAKESQRLGCNR